MHVLRALPRPGVLGHQLSAPLSPSPLRTPISYSPQGESAATGPRRRHAHQRAERGGGAWAGTPDQDPYLPGSRRTSPCIRGGTASRPVSGCCCAEAGAAPPQHSRGRASPEGKHVSRQVDGNRGRETGAGNKGREALQASPGTRHRPAGPPLGPPRGLVPMHVKSRPGENPALAATSPGHGCHVPARHAPPAYRSTRKLRRGPGSGPDPRIAPPPAAAAARHSQGPTTLSRTHSPPPSAPLPASTASPPSAPA